MTGQNHRLDTAIIAIFSRSPKHCYLHTYTYNHIYILFIYIILHNYIYIMSILVLSDIVQLHAHLFAGSHVWSESPSWYISISLGHIPKSEHGSRRNT